MQSNLEQSQRSFFPKFSSPCSKSFMVLTCQINSKFLTLAFQLSLDPVLTYHCYFISPHAPYSSTLQSNCITLRLQTPHTLLPPSSLSRSSFCLKCPLPPPPRPVSGALLSAEPSLSPTDMSLPPSGLCFMYLVGS